MMGPVPASRESLPMLMDLYELTMARGYLEEGVGQTPTAFDVFYRRNPDGGGFAIFAGLEQILDYLETLRFTPNDVAYLRSLGLFTEGFLSWLAGFRFSGTVTAVPEGTVVYPDEPLMTVCGPVMEAQLIETAILNQINHQTLIATKARRMVAAAKGRSVADFGARRAHNADAALYGARAAYIGGVDSTATVLAGQLFGIPVSGTMAHSWVMFHDSEHDAFERFARSYPEDCVLLVDTYDVLKSGVPNAIRVAREVFEPEGHRLKGIRIDSGDLAYLSKEARRMLDEAGLGDCAISVSNSLDENTIRSLIDQEAPIDAFGVDERLATAKSDPVFGAVYKLVAVGKDRACIPRIKVSETFEKITNPGRKKLWRVYDAQGCSVGDLITSPEEDPREGKSFRYIDPRSPWKEREFVGCSYRELHEIVIEGGKRVAAPRPLEDIRAYVTRQLEDEVWSEEQRLENPHAHYLDMSLDYYQTKISLLGESRRPHRAP